MTGAIECRYYGRDFTAEEMALLHALLAADPQPTRAALSREFCRRIGWLKPDDGLKDMMAKVTMLAMHRDGVITLPPPRGRQGRPKPIVFGPDTEPPLFPAPTSLDEVRPLEMRIVVRGTREGRLWNEFVARYHYLGYKTLVGAQMRYAIHDRDGWLRRRLPKRRLPLTKETSPRSRDGSTRSRRRACCRAMPLTRTRAQELRAPRSCGWSIADISPRTPTRWTLRGAASRTGLLVTCTCRRSSPGC